MTIDSSITSLSPSEKKGSEPKSRRNRLLENWALWGCLTLLGAVALGGGSVYMLITQPPKPDCSFVVWPVAPASVRLYCAQELTQDPTLENLIKAIALVDELDTNHPLRGAINPRIEAWSEMLLDRAADTFHRGEIGKAIEFAHKIPLKTQASKLVEERTSRWRRIWAEGEAIDARVEFALQEENWRKAFGLMVDLLYVDNRYFSETRYERITDMIIQAQKDEKKVIEAEQALKAGDFESLEKSLALVRELSDNTIFRLSQKKIFNGVAEDLVAFAETALEEERLTNAIDALTLIPRESRLWNYSQDLSKIANATSLTWAVSSDGYERAIAELQEIPKDSPVHSRAQTLIQRWTGEIQTVKQLENAQLKALSGDITDLQEAIAIAQTIPRSSDKWEMAQDDIQGWVSQIERTEDQPILDLADELAVPGDEASLQAAIAQAQKIGPRRVMFGEAQTRIRYWRARLQDWVAYREDTFAPIVVEETSVFDETETVEFEETPPVTEENVTEVEPVEASPLAQAIEVAQPGTPEALRAAMDLANQIPINSVERTQADYKINSWGNQLLVQAESQVNINPDIALAIASRIPPYSGAYNQAQSLIRELSNARALQPAPTVP